jgi:HAE1 family hydrophobic/amphiphilic exporter-1
MISKFFIERPIFANVIAIIFIIIGFVCLYRLPVSQYPNIVPPTIQVSTRYPGASAEVIAATVGAPIEQAVNGVENSIYMNSTSSNDGSYSLVITFNVGTDLNTSLALVQNQLTTATAQLPEAVQLQGITIKKINTNILLVVSLYSEDNRFDEAFLSNYAVINMQYPLGRLPGMGQVRVVGAGPYSMRVWLDPHRLQSYDLTTQDVLTAIRGQNVQVVAGQLGGPPVPLDQTNQFTINALGRLSDVTQFENIIVKSSRGTTAKIVRLKDVARVDLSQQYFSNYANVGGLRSAQIVMYALPDANSIDVANAVYKAVEKMSKDFPKGLNYTIRYDTTRFVRDTVTKVYETLFEAAVLVLLVIMVFLQNWRATLVPATTIPVTIIGAFAAMAALGFGVNLMTLFALILAIGIVVDDAIVIVENSSYHVEQGLPPKEATEIAMREVTGPVIGITLVLVSVFLPAAFFPGITGQLFRQFALVIAATAVISAINALTLKPAQCALWLRPKDDKKENWFYRNFNKVYQLMEDAYLAMVSRMVRHPGLMLLVFLIIIGLAGFIYTLQPVGFLPVEDQGYAVLISRLPDAASQPRSREASEQIDAILKKTPGVSSWVTIGGFSLLDGANVSNISTTFIVYKPWSQRSSDESQENIVSGLNRRLATVPDTIAFVLVPPSIRGLGQAGGFQLMLEDRRGLGLAELDKVSKELIQSGNSQSGLRGLTTTFSAGSPQIYLAIDRTKAESLQVPLSNVFDTLQSYLGSSFINLFNKFNQVFQVYIQADAPYRLRREDIKKLYTRNLKNQMVPLGTLLEVQRTIGAELVTRYNLYPAAAIFGSAAPGFSSGQALNLMEQVAANTLPQGISAEWTATSYQEKQVGYQAYAIYALAITLVYLVLAAQYESWTSPVAVILAVPMALVGIILAQMARGFDNNLYSQVGLVLMIALASKNAILIVEFARDMRYHHGLSIAEAAVEATRRRFRPIIMTSFAFIMGVLPLLYANGAGAASQRAIGTVVFGGMLSSTLLAIPFVPVFFVIMQGLSERYERKHKQAVSRKEEIG